MKLIEFLQLSGIDLSSELQQDLLGTLVKKVYEKGDYFHKEGRVCKELGLLIEGQVALIHLVDGTEFTRWVGIKNTFITSLGSFINEVASINGLRFLSDAKVEVMTKKDFDRLLYTYPEFQQFVIRAISQDLVKYQYLADLFITTKGTERYLKFQEKYPQIVQEIPQKYIASILGMNPRHLSRIRKKLTTTPK
ncbi:Crp/Fnr family transcriptional regulator [Aureibaculum sp. 2210JD6-5]|uniref:Crp/Fnr family transcriptional regulator n=1 Tax=Aureibaculum sp. 2210JD6-5 TaxID=3103957 RepID=UPI002AAEA645|nr:Crp/Fnr family transcriptional regulator [Aureibaculum sp. 2210JD6-5]MDY7396451.1 Crp/Fnr family transcriptional regulator [Aureibaculum sp. 2210JD6-5]